MSIPTQQHIINGEFVPPSSGQYIDLIDPVSGQVAGKAAQKASLSGSWGALGGS